MAYRFCRGSTATAVAIKPITTPIATIAASTITAMR
jgi:hypothetical protein